MNTIIPLSELFNYTIYRIPDYQRGYSWTKEQLDDLWADLANTHTHRNAFHFTGILTVSNFSEEDYEKIIQEGFSVSKNDLGEKKIIINNQKFKGYNLVDGQQRLTTILILLSQLLSKLTNPAERASYSRKYFYNYDQGKNKYLFGYHVDVPSYNYLIHDIFEDDSYDAELTETLYTHNLDFAKGYFREKLDDFSQNEIKDTLCKLTDRLLFSILNINEKESNLDVSMVFETLNFRGKPLSGLERFKNRVLYLLSKQPFNSATRRNLINRTWLEVYKWLGKNKHRPLEDDAFLKAFWILYFSNSQMVSKDFKAYQKNLFEKDFSLINISENKMMSPAELQRWLRLMRRAIKLWYFIHNPYAVDGDSDFNYYYSTRIQRSLQRLNTFPRGFGRYMLNLVLALLIKELPEKEDESTDQDQLNQKLKEIEEILWLMERHNIMCFILNGNNSSFNQEKTFRDVKSFYLRSDIQKLKDTLREQRVDHFNWKNVKRFIHQNNHFLSWSGIHFILKEYEEIISKQKVDEDFSINLIYPDEDHRTQRIFFQNINSLQLHNRKRYTYSLGNLYISNNPHPQRSFKDYRDRVVNAQNRNYFLFQSEKDILAYKDWTMETIVDRGKTIMNAIIEKWDIPRPPLNFYQEFFGH